VPFPSLAGVLKNWCGVTAWEKVDGSLAWFFGLDQPKYKWAIDEYHNQKEQVGMQAMPGIRSTVASLASHSTLWVTPS
jgi:hypothetical protein